MNYWGYILLAVWLIVSGLNRLLHFSFDGINVLLSIIALIAGILLIIGGLKTKFANNLGGLALSIWLILRGLQAFFHFQQDSVIIAIIAVIAGVLLLVKK